MTFLHALAELLVVVVRQDTDTISMEKQFITGLQPEASWLTAIYKNVANQSLYNNVVKEILNGILRNESLKNHQTSYFFRSLNEFLENHFNVLFNDFFLRSIGWIVLSLVSHIHSIFSSSNL